MTSKQVWIVFTKSRPLAGCPIDVDGCEFYYAEAYLPFVGPDGVTGSFDQMLAAVKDALLDKKLELVDVSMLTRYNNEQWSITSDSGNDVNALAYKALEDNQIVFSGFRSEEIEGLIQYRHSISEMDYN